MEHSSTRSCLLGLYETQRAFFLFFFFLFTSDTPVHTLVILQSILVLLSHFLSFEHLDLRFLSFCHRNDQDIAVFSQLVCSSSFVNIRGVNNVVCALSSPMFAFFLNSHTFPERTKVAVTNSRSIIKHPSSLRAVYFFVPVLFIIMNLRVPKLVTSSSFCNLTKNCPSPKVSPEVGCLRSTAPDIYSIYVVCYVVVCYQLKSTQIKRSCTRGHSASTMHDASFRDVGYMFFPHSRKRGEGGCKNT